MDPNKDAADKDIMASDKTKTRSSRAKSPGASTRSKPAPIGAVSDAELERVQAAELARLMTSPDRFINRELSTSFARAAALSLDLSQ